MGRNAGRALKSRAVITSHSGKFCRCSLRVVIGSLERPTDLSVSGAFLFLKQANTEQAHESFDFGLLHVDHFS